jgi:ribosomal protein L11 methylase PrmA
MDIAVYLTILVFLSLDLLILLALSLRMVLPFLFHGPFYVPAPEERIEKMLRLLEIRPGDKAVDLGSGDGRLVIALVKRGVETHGYEINPFLVWLSRWKINRAGLRDKAFIRWQNFWPEDLSRFSIVVVYAISFVMRDLEDKLRKELKAGAQVVSHYFAFPGWPETRREGEVRLYRQNKIL